MKKRKPLKLFHHFHHCTMKINYVKNNFSFILQRKTISLISPCTSVQWYCNCRYHQSSAQRTFAWWTFSLKIQKITFKDSFPLYTIVTRGNMGNAIKIRKISKVIGKKLRVQENFFSYSRCLAPSTFNLHPFGHIIDWMTRGQ